MKSININQNGTVNESEIIRIDHDVIKYIDDYKVIKINEPVKYRYYMEYQTNQFEIGEYFLIADSVAYPLGGDITYQNLPNNSDDVRFIEESFTRY